MVQPLVVGMDIAKKDFAVACRIGAVAVELGKFANNAESYESLHAALVRVCTQQGLSAIQLVLEDTGAMKRPCSPMPNPKKVCD